MTHLNRMNKWHLSYSCSVRLCPHSHRWLLSAISHTKRRHRPCDSHCAPSAAPRPQRSTPSRSPCHPAPCLPAAHSGRAHSRRAAVTGPARRATQGRSAQRDLTWSAAHGGALPIGKSIGGASNRESSRWSIARGTPLGSVLFVLARS